MLRLNSKIVTHVTCHMFRSEEAARSAGHGEADRSSVQVNNKINLKCKKIGKLKLPMLKALLPKRNLSRIR